jgi:hypothetical protein
MKKALLILAAVCCGIPALAETEADATRQILALEHQAMDGWLTGNPDPALAISDPEITYFHAVTEKRLEGLPALKALYEKFRGTPLFDSYDILDPRVQFAGDAAVLTYHFVRHNGAAVSHWNATQVYRRTKEGWRVIHSHFSVMRSAQQ